ncbi:MAG: glycolate oxidase subunit GlcE [Ramlibacter sp.]|jgi:glycolate oxidase FAD binding subunit|nr:glycolate oxidase subunit GlcE [Ramlibacter sp.]
MAAMDPTLSPFIDRIRAAAASGTPLRFRGGGTKDFFGESLQGELLETAPLAGITSYEPSELVVTVRAGTPLAELEAVLAEKGQCLPFEPPHYGGAAGSEATVGGMVAAGLSGPARATVGAVRDYVLGLSMINGRAEPLTFGGQVMKNVAGYDVSRLMCGSLGTLGLITEVSLKVLPVAPAEATLRFDMDEATAIRRLNQWAGQPLPLNASSWVVDAGQPVLYLRLRGAVAAVQAACERMLREAGGERVDSPATTADWTAARDLRLPWFSDGFARGQDLWRLSVPQVAPPLGVGDTLIDWLGAQRWVWADAGDAQAAQRLRAAAAAAGGHATLFIANQPASTGATARFDALKPPLDRIHRELKREFDPAGIFNPGRLVAQA